MAYPYDIEAEVKRWIAEAWRQAMRGYEGDPIHVAMRGMRFHLEYGSKVGWRIWMPSADGRLRIAAFPVLDQSWMEVDAESVNRAMRETVESMTREWLRDAEAGA